MQLMSLKEVDMNNDLKATISGIVATIGMILKIVHVNIPQEVSDAIVTIGIFAIGFFANRKDK